MSAFMLPRALLPAMSEGRSAGRRLRRGRLSEGRSAGRRLRRGRRQVGSGGTANRAAWTPARQSLIFPGSPVAGQAAPGGREGPPPSAARQGRDRGTPAGGAVVDDTEWYTGVAGRPPASVFRGRGERSTRGTPLPHWAALRSRAQHLICASLSAIDAGSAQLLPPAFVTSACNERQVHR